MQAAFLNVKLPHLDAENQFRRQIAKRYLPEIKNDKLVLPFFFFFENHVFHLFIIRTSNRKQLQPYFFENKIETMIHYPIPPHKQKAISIWNHLSFPITEKIHEEVVSIPMNASLTDDDIEQIITVLNKY